MAKYCDIGLKSILFLIYQSIDATEIINVTGKKEKRLELVEKALEKVLMNDLI